MSTAEILRHLNHKHHHGSISPSSSHSSLSIESAKSNQTAGKHNAIAFVLLLQVSLSIHFTLKLQLKQLLPLRKHKQKCIQPC